MSESDAKVSCTATHLHLDLSSIALGDKAILASTRSLAFDYSRIYRYCSWSCHSWDNELRFSKTFGEALAAVDKLLPLLTECYHGMYDPLYSLPRELWQVICTCHQELQALDDWVIVNIHQAHVPLSGSEHSYSLFAEDLAERFCYDHTDEVSRTVQELTRRLVICRKDLKLHLAPSQTRMKSRSDAIAHKLVGLSEEARASLRHLYLDALHDHFWCEVSQDIRGSWRSISNVIVWPNMTDFLQPEHDLSAYWDLVQHALKREMLLALENTILDAKSPNVEYIYSAFQNASQQIRLISDIWEHPSGNLSLKLVTMSLDGSKIDASSEEAREHTLNFEALSYTWGEYNELRHVWIDGKKLRIQKNAFNFLRHHSRYFANRNSKMCHTKQRPLWIDSICIDQKNVKEKNAQVGVMNKIYGRAARVIVWLEDWSDNVRHRSKWNMFHSGLDFNEFSTFDFGRHRREEIADNFCRRIVTAVGNICSECDNYLLTRLDKRASRKDKPSREAKHHVYWQRLWPIQELSLARHEPEIIVLDRKIPLAQACDASSDQSSHMKPHQDARGLLERYKITSRQAIPIKLLKGSKLTLSKLLQEHGNRDCSDKRDVVYALLSMTPYTSTFDVDYNESLKNLLHRASTLLIEERAQDHTATLREYMDFTNFLDDEPLIRLARALDLFSVATLLELCDTVSPSQASTILTPSVLIKVVLQSFGTRRLSATEIGLTWKSATESKKGTNERPIESNPTSLISEVTNSVCHCLAYGPLRYRDDAERDENPDSDGIECLREWVILQPLELRALIACRDGYIEIVCFCYGDQLHPIPRDVKQRWETCLKAQRKTWSQAWKTSRSDFFHIRLPNSIIEVAYLAEVQRSLPAYRNVLGVKRRAVRSDKYTEFHGQNLPDIIRRMCPPAEPLIPARFTRLVSLSKPDPQPQQQRRDLDFGQDWELT